jgi:hypothetical protein
MKGVERKLDVDGAEPSPWKMSKKKKNDVKCLCRAESTATTL